ncbi:MAG: DUF305 domain-containing protein [Gemmatimonadaceae bacterium]|nr:DUF305 domain-containing protein [Gemmatimonadaceae bacterium]
MTLHRTIVLAVGAAWSAAVACGPPAAPGTAPAPESAPPVPSAPTGHVHTPVATHTASALPADARFFHHMIPHHAQALVMTALVPARASRPELRLVAERIAVSQRDEIAQMQAWLRANGHEVPPVDTLLPGQPEHAAHGGHAGHAMADPSHAGMPGMLTPQELQSLAAARAPAFDRLFLELMIRHHEGAITMVRDLFASGGGQDSQVYVIASEVESDQRMEVARMQSILATLPSAAPRSR